MHRDSGSVRKVLLFVVLGIVVSALVTGCDLIDQILDAISPGGGTTGSPQAVMTAVIDDDLVDAGLNPDLRPPLWYQFSSVGSLNEDGDSIYDSMAGIHALAWDFGDGNLRGFEWSDRAPRHSYKQEGTYVASLTVRAEASGDTDTIEQTITIGPAWLEIVSLTWEDRPDGRADITVAVRNQSRQALRGIAVDLFLDGSLWMGTALSASFTAETTPVSLSPGATYTLRTTVGSWAGTLTASSGWCTPYPLAP